MLRRRPVARVATAAVVGGAVYGAGKNSANNANQDASQTAAINQQQADIDALAAQNAALQQQMAAQQAPVAQPAAPQVSNQQDELAKLAKMFQDGLINEAEYSAAKAKVLGL
jgi:multidrug resistance efflux pump